MFPPSFAFQKSQCGRFLTVNLSLLWLNQRNSDMTKRGTKTLHMLASLKGLKDCLQNDYGSVQNRMCIILPSVCPLLSFPLSCDSIPLHSPLFNLLLERKCSLRHSTCYQEVLTILYHSKFNQVVYLYPLLNNWPQAKFCTHPQYSQCSSEMIRKVVMQRSIENLCHEVEASANH